MGDQRTAKANGWRKVRSYQALDASTERARVIALLDCGHRQVVERVKGTKAKVRCWYCQELGAAAGALQ